MEKSNLSLFFLGCLLSSTFAFAKANWWCTTQPGALEDGLKGFIDYGCGIVDCAAIQPGAPCFNPNTLQSHGSYVLNAVYGKLGTCNLDVGHKTPFDPSYGGCRYPSRIKEASDSIN